MPGYSGFLPNTMLTQSLVTTRELLLAGQPSLALHQGISVPLPSWDDGGTHRFPKPESDRAILRLQPNVRAVLAEIELLGSISFARGTSQRSLSLRYQEAGTGAATDLCSLRVPSRDVFEDQLVRVIGYAELRMERINEIVSQVVPQTANWSSIAGMTPERHRYSWELIGIGLRFAMMVVMRFKSAFEVPRPGELSALVQPIVLTPGYSAYPSGHATEANFVATVLPRLAAAEDAIHGSSRHDASFLGHQLRRLAFRVAENRVVAGLHYPVDSLAGQLLGVVLGEFFVAACGDGHAIQDATFPRQPVNSRETEAAIDQELRTAEPTLDRTVCGVEPMPSNPMYRDGKLEASSRAKPEKLFTKGARSLVVRGEGFTVLRALWRAARDEWA